METLFFLCWTSYSSWAFAFNHDRTMLFIFLLAHPHLLERAAWTEDRASNPRCKSFLSWAHYLYAYVLRSDFRHLLLQAFQKSVEARVSARDYDVLEQVTSDVDVSFTDGVYYHVLNACKAFDFFRCLEHLLKYSDSLAANWSGLSIWEFNLLGSNRLCSTQALYRLFRNLEERLFYVFNNLHLGILKVTWVAVLHFNGYRSEVFYAINICKFALKTKSGFHF